MNNSHLPRILAAISCCFLIFTGCSTSQITLSNFTKYTTSGKAVQVHAGNASVRFMFYKDDVLRVDYLPDSATVPDTSFVVVHDTSIAITPGVVETDSTIVISSNQIQVVCKKNPLRISYYNSSNGLILSEPSSGGLIKNGLNRTAVFTMQSDEHFYGTGERGNALDKRGLSFDSYNVSTGGYTSQVSNMAANIPFLPTSKGYALYFDNTYKGKYDLGYSNSDRYFYTATGGELTYYLILGETIPKQIENYTWLTGRQPMPPKWALGFIQSKYGYRNQTEAQSMVQTMRDKKIPCDAIVIDLYWFNYMGDIAWKLSSWPQPMQMMSDFKSMGMKTILITEPYITQPSLNYGEGVGLGYLAKNPNGQPFAMSNWWSCGCNSYLLDITNPGAQSWWWSKHPSFFGNDLAGIWTDLGEPERHPDSMKHYLGTPAKIHNIYNLLWAKTIFDGVNDLRPNQRFFNLTRSGFAGIQRYGVSIWSGDVGRGFGGLAVQLPMVLNMGMSGIGYHNSDIGGFCCGTTTPELYARWMQYGTFCPITRAHGVDQTPEPWAYGAEVEAISKKYIELRYQLLPYIYTMAYENHKTGLPLARPLMFDYPTDAQLTNESSSYLWGSSMLVSPVTVEGQTSKSLYLPEGKWVNFWTDKEVTGGQTITTSAPIETMPLFVKSGSIIPMQFVMNYTDEKPLDTLRLACYPSKEYTGSFTMYEDDGKTLDYQLGSYTTTQFSLHCDVSASDTSVVINIGKTNGAYTGKPLNRVYISEIHGIISKPNSVRSNSVLISEQESYTSLRQHTDGFYYDSTSHILYIQTPTIPDSTYEIIAENVHLLGVNDSPETLPSKSYRLDQNYPNPFNPKTEFGFRIGTSGLVTLKVFDVLGKEIATVVNDNLPAGDYKREWDASGIASGTYLYKLQSGEFTDSKKLILLR